MEEIKLEDNCWYLVESTPYSDISEIKINYISEKAINCTIKRSDGTIYYEWYSKKYFIEKYLIIEKLPHSIQPIINDEYNDFDLLNHKLLVDSVCPYCGGDGQIPDDSITAGKKLCPKCFGYGRI